jgi:hypothetical protein
MRYDCNNEEKLQYIEFGCPDCFTKELINTLKYTRDFESVSLYANADFITGVVRILLNVTVDDEPFKFGMFDIDGEGCDYCGEYVLSINDDKTIWCEKAFRDGEMFDSDSFLNFVHTDCSSEVIEYLINNDQRIMEFDIAE